MNIGGHLCETSDGFHFTYCSQPEQLKLLLYAAVLYCESCLMKPLVHLIVTILISLLDVNNYCLFFNLQQKGSQIYLYPKTELTVHLYIAY